MFTYTFMKVEVERVKVRGREDCRGQDEENIWSWCPRLEEMEVVKVVEEIVNMMKEIEVVAMVKVERVMVKVRGREDGGNEKMERTR